MGNNYDVKYTKLFSPGEEFKECCRCKEVKNKNEFYKHKRSRDGLSAWCKDCERAAKQRYAESPKRKVTEKRCNKCKEVKPANAFNRDRHNSCGLTSWCKECQAKVRKKRIKLDTHLPEQKRCYRCGVIKLQQDFYKDPARPDGLTNECKQCRKIMDAVSYVKKQFRKTIEPKLSLAVNGWDQAGDVLREMAELQVAVEKEKNKVKKIVETIKADAADAVVSLAARQFRLQQAIEYFVKRNRSGCKRIERHFRFGTIYYYRNKLGVKLDVATAEENIGKP